MNMRCVVCGKFLPRVGYDGKQVGNVFVPACSTNCKDKITEDHAWNHGI